MHLIAHILNRAPPPHNQRLTKIRLKPLPLRINPHELQLLPAPINHIRQPKIEFAAHDDGVRFACELVEVLEGDGVDFVVDVEALYVFAVVDHDGVDEVIYRGVLVADQDLGVEHLVVFEDLVDEFFVQAALWGRLEVNFHAAGFFGLEVDVAGMCELNDVWNAWFGGAYGGSRFRRMPTASSSASSSLLCSAFFVASRIMRIRSLVFAALIT